MHEMVWFSSNILFGRPLWICWRDYHHLVMSTHMYRHAFRHSIHVPCMQFAFPVFHNRWPMSQRSLWMASKLVFDSEMSHFLVDRSRRLASVWTMPDRLRTDRGFWLLESQSYDEYPGICTTLPHQCQQDRLAALRRRLVNLNAVKYGSVQFL